MKHSEFVESLAETYPGLPEPVKKEIRSWINGFTEDQLEKIYSKFKGSKAAEFAPKGVYPFEQICEQFGIQKGDDGKFLLWWKCNICGCLFSRQSRGCPKCQSKRFSGHMGKKFPTEILFVKDGCYNCKTYLSPFRPQGPSCHEYGKLDNGVMKPDYPPQPSQCKGCRCAVCCSQDYAARVKDRDRLVVLSGIASEKAVESFLN